MAVTPRRIADFELGQRIAAGGMGEVFAAVQWQGGRPVRRAALKLMHARLSDDEAYVKMFLSEARVLSHLVHPNIVGVLDVGLVDGRYYLAMEFVDGVSLASLITALRLGGQQAPADALWSVARQAAAGLHAAHTAVTAQGQPLKLVHRDISAGNVLVSRRGEVKLADFGIARYEGSEGFTSPGAVRGKLEYLAPELIRGQPFDVRCDVYALGQTLYRVAALRSPYPSGSGSVAPTVAVEVPPLDTVRPDLPPAFVALVQRALERDPARRFATAQAVEEACPGGGEQAGVAQLARLVSELCQPQVELLGESWLDLPPVDGPSSAARSPGRGPAGTVLDRASDPARPALEEAVPTTESARAMGGLPTVNGRPPEPDDAHLRQTDPLRPMGGAQTVVARAHPRGRERLEGRGAAPGAEAPPTPAPVTGLTSAETVAHLAEVGPVPSRPLAQRAGTDSVVKTALTEPAARRHGVPGWLWALGAVLLLGTLSLLGVALHQGPPPSAPPPVAR